MLVHVSVPAVVSIEHDVMPIDIPASGGGSATQMGTFSTLTGTSCRVTGCDSGSCPPPPPAPASPGTTAHVMTLPSICMQSFAVEQGAPTGTCPAKTAWHVARADDRLPGSGWQLWPFAAC